MINIQILIPNNVPLLPLEGCDGESGGTNISTDGGSMVQGFQNIECRVFVLNSWIFWGIIYMLYVRLMVSSPHSSVTQASVHCTTWYSSSSRSAHTAGAGAGRGGAGGVAGFEEYDCIMWCDCTLPSATHTCWTVTRCEAPHSRTSPSPHQPGHIAPHYHSGVGRDNDQMTRYIIILLKSVRF